MAANRSLQEPLVKTVPISRPPAPIGRPITPDALPQNSLWYERIWWGIMRIVSASTKVGTDFCLFVEPFKELMDGAHQNGQLPPPEALGPRCPGSAPSHPQRNEQRGDDPSAVVAKRGELNDTNPALSTFRDQKVGKEEQGGDAY